MDRFDDESQAVTSRFKLYQVPTWDGWAFEIAAFGRKCYAEGRAVRTGEARAGGQTVSHKQVAPQYCPKCGQKMNGPFFAAAHWTDPEHLDFCCPCGFKTKVPTMDSPESEKPAPEVKP